MSECVFCNIDPSRFLLDYDNWMVVEDGFPISKGHTLIIPREHYTDFFHIDTGAWDELHEVIKDVKCMLDFAFDPDGYNIGINYGKAAGQTVGHLHIHVIPRYNDDVEDPRGGVRWIMPDKAKYW